MSAELAVVEYKTESLRERTESAPSDETQKTQGSNGASQAPKFNFADNPMGCSGSIGNLDCDRTPGSSIDGSR
jgi:hypothetical protein